MVIFIGLLENYENYLKNLTRDDTLLMKILIPIFTPEEVKIKMKKENKKNKSEIREYLMKKMYNKSTYQTQPTNQFVHQVYY